MLMLNRMRSKPEINLLSNECFPVNCPLILETISNLWVACRLKNNQKHMMQ